MNFNSVEFLIFFPIVLLFYYLLPKKVRWVWLLISSYYFYMSWNVKYSLIILGVTIVSWAGGMLIQKVNGEGKVKEKKIILTFSILGILAVLITFKYANLLLNTLYSFMNVFNISVENRYVGLVLPVGISFYSFQAIAYLVDVYRSDIKAEKNLLRYALFISFFPQLVAGPIERSKNLMSQIYAEHSFDRERVASGFLLMCWGFFKKVIIADRAAVIVDLVYNNYSYASGMQIIIATICFAIQLYCDFSAYSDIAIGAARVVGFTLMTNFKSPYYSLTVAEFWRRWHISLSSWFKDYVYIPLGGNRKGKLVKYRNLLITFAISGLWHGANWNFLIWGLLNGIYQVIGDITKKFRVKVIELVKINSDCYSFRLIQGLITFALIDFSYMFFRGNSFFDTIAMIRRIGSNFSWMSIFDLSTFMGLYTFTLDEKDFYLFIIAVIILLVIDAVKNKVDLINFILKQNFYFRYLCYYLMIMSVLIFGYYGPEYNLTSFIYFQF